MDNKTEEKYIEMMRKKSGEERLKIAMRLNKSELERMKAEIRGKHPNISSREFKKLLFKKRYGYGRPF